MRFLITIPAAPATRTGNRCTAEQWAAHLIALGHEATITDAWTDDPADALIALHAARSRAAVLAFRAAHAHRPIVVALTGTDAYPELDPDGLDALRAADRIVGLQPDVRGRVPPDLRDKLRIIVQSAAAPSTSPAQANGHFDVSVIGHLRAVKDPLRAATAARALPASSRLRVRHAGAILEPPYAAAVEREQAENPRYTWLGELEEHDAAALLGASRLSVVSSHHEGGARVVGEAAVAGTPLLAARNGATESLLGADYPGLYDAGDTAALTALLARAEEDPAFLDELRARTAAAAPQFDPAREREAWRRLIEEIA